MGILQLLAKENYIAYSKPLAKIVGIDEAILFGALCSICNIHGDEFFCQQERLCEDTCLTEYRLRNAMKNLEKFGLVSIVKKGLPAKNYYCLSEETFLNLMNIQSTSGTKFDTTGSNKSDTTSEGNSDSTYKKQDIKNNNKKINKKKERKTTSYDEILSAVTDDSLRDLYLEYIKMRKLIKSPMTDRALTMLIKKVNELEQTTDRQKMLLETAIMNNWKSVYPLKDEPKKADDNKKYGGTWV